MSNRFDHVKGFRMKNILFQLRLTWRLMRDRRVPFYLKLIPFIGFLYVISPVDFIPDVFLIIGQLDDLGLIIFGIHAFKYVVPEHILAEHVEAMNAKHEVIFVDSKANKDE